VTGAEDFVLVYRNSEGQVQLIGSWHPHEDVIDCLRDDLAELAREHNAKWDKALEKALVHGHIGADGRGVIDGHGPREGS
jgi:hypothetical protein